VTVRRSPGQRLLVLPELRNFFIEGLVGANWDQVLYSRTAYLDDDAEHLLPAARRAGGLRLLRTLATTPARAVQVPEPLWVRHLLLSIACLGVVRLRALVTRRPVRTAAVAIENASPETIAATVPLLPARASLLVLRLLVRVHLSLLDELWYATRDARQAHVALFGRDPVQFVDGGGVAELPVVRCGCLAEESAATTDEFVYAGAFEERKGLRLLLGAWTELEARSDVGRLSLIGSGPLRDDLVTAAAGLSRVEVVEMPAREEIHSRLRRAHGVVLLSQRDGRWREQIGSVIQEGLSHGCAVVTTDETGLAAWLAEQGHAVVPADALPAAVAEELLTVLKAPRTPPCDIPLTRAAPADRWWFN
jgi:glycosyltransferase involved in cell wall biosynthesis